MSGFSLQLSFSQDCVDSRFIKTLTNLCTTCAFVHSFTLTLLLILFFGTIGNIDARPQSSLQSERENVTCRTIEAFINTQTTLQLDVSNSCTESIRAVRVCNTPVSHRVFKKNCRGKNVAIDFSNCFHQTLTCKFTYDCW